MPHRNAPLKRPTNLDPLYPDPWSHWHEVDAKIDRAIVWAGRLIGVAFIAVGGLTLWRAFV